MGSGISSAITTHGQLFDKTAGTRRMVDDIFTYMMQHLKVNDFMNLSNPEKCQKYVLFMANNLSMFFSKLSVRPEVGKDGILAFRSAEDLQDPKGPAKQEKESLCLVLAYFYTRIFQIYGAIALTLLDDIKYTVEMSTLMSARSAPTDSIGPTIPTPGDPYTYVEPRAHKQLRTDPFRGGQIGGWIAKLGYFDFMNRGLLVDQPVPQQPYFNPYGYAQAPPATTAPTNQYGYTVNYVYKDDKHKYMYFNPDPVDVAGRDVAATSSQKGTFRWVDSQKKIFEIMVSVRRIDDDNHAQFSVDSIRFRKPREPTDTVLKKEEIRSVLSNGKSPEEVIHETITIASSHAFPSISSTQPSQGSYEAVGYTDINSYFKALFATLIPYVTKQYDSGDSIAGRSGMDAMNIRRFYENFTNVKPLGHCIARALQLLNADPYGRDENGKQFVSSMCKTSFFVPQGKTESERRGVPKPDEPITESPGIMSLALLFYDTVGKATPHIFMSKPAFEQYKTFMKQMAGLFMGKEAAVALHIDQMDVRAIYPKTAQEEKEKIKLTADGKSEIIDRRTFDQKQSIKKGLCAPDQKDKPIPLDPDTKQNVHAIVRQLFQRQLNHAVKCEGILKQMFTMERNDTMPVRIKISDALLKGGLAAVNSLNAQVRQILIQYYSDCESMYLVGVKHIEHQGIKHKQQDDARKKQAELVQQRVVAEQNAKRNAAASPSRGAPIGTTGAPAPPFVKPAVPLGNPAVPLGNPTVPLGNPTVPLGNPTVPSVKPAAPFVAPIKSVANQTAKQAEELLKKRERIHQELKTAGPQGVNQLVVDLNNAGMKKELIDTIIDRIKRGELSYVNVQEALRTRGLKGVSDYIISSTGSRRSTRSVRFEGGSHTVTSSFHTTRRWKRT